MFMATYEAQTDVGKRYLRGTIGADVKRSQGSAQLAELKGLIRPEKYRMLLVHFHNRVNSNMTEIGKYTRCTITDVTTCGSPRTKAQQDYLDKTRSQW